VPQDPEAKNELAKEGKMAFDFGKFWFKGQQIRTGQANVKGYNRELAALIHHGRATPSQIISHRLSLEEGPAAYKHFDDRDEGWTKVILKPGK
jgi:glutathione-independent formaldehyde dehydrogenase